MSSDRFEKARAEIQSKVRQGQIEDALELSEDALRTAEESGDAYEIDRATCNHGNILVGLERCEEWIPRLRRILMRNRDPLIRYLASYAISHHHCQSREIERGIFYARLALDEAKRTDEDEYVAFAHNNLANVLTRDSRFEEAASHYSSFLDLYPETSLERVVTVGSLGYCRATLGEYDDAFRHLRWCLRELRSMDADVRWSRFAHLGLAYTYLEVERFEPARRHARHALELSETAEGSQEVVKNGLYLLGEAEKLSGNDDAAFECFLRLQEEFYPDKPFVVDVLLSTDIRRMINLMA